MYDCIHEPLKFHFKATLSFSRSLWHCWLLSRLGSSGAAREHNMRSGATRKIGREIASLACLPPHNSFKKQRGAPSVCAFLQYWCPVQGRHTEALPSCIIGRKLGRCSSFPPPPRCYPGNYSFVMPTEGSSGSWAVPTAFFCCL